MLLVDGSNLLHRAVNTPLAAQRNSGGKCVGGVRGAIQSLGALCKAHKLQEGVVIAWDLGSSSFRKEIYPDYKGSSSHGEFYFCDDSEKETYFWSRDFLHRKLLPLTGSLSIQIQCVEADDIIAWCVRRLEDADLTIVSTDEDYFQLVDDTVSVYNPIKKVTITKESLIDEWNLLESYYKKQVVMIKAITGDQSDNIPGIKGLGFSRAHEIVNAIMTGGELELDQSKSFIKTFLKEKKNFEKYCKVINLNVDLPKEYNDKIESAIKLASSLELSLESWVSLNSILRELELNNSMHSAESILKSNQNSYLLEQIQEIF